MIIFIVLSILENNLDKLRVKPLINVSDKPILYHLIHNLELTSSDYIYIPYDSECLDDNFESMIKKNYPKINFKFFLKPQHIKNSLEMIYTCINQLELDEDQPVLMLNSNSMYLNNIINLWNSTNCVFTINCKSHEDGYTYVQTNNKGNITEIKSREAISNYSSTGAYGFQSILEFKKYMNKIKINDGTLEFLILDVIRDMIKNNIIFNNNVIFNKDYFSLRTWKEIDEYENPLLFDLDGTLVDTDEIYKDVWNTIMNQFNISIDEDFFRFFIQGKNDTCFLKGLIPNITNKKILDISSLKDSLFIDKLNEYNDNITIDGAVEFIHKNRNRRMCIVTSCNKKSAQFILKKIGLEEYMMFILASEDCERHKPDKFPYEKAVQKLNCLKEKCTIFEDSQSGYRSAVNSGISKICIVLNRNTHESILNNKAYKIKNYQSFSFDKIKDRKIILLSSHIKRSIKSFNIEDIILNNHNLKSGYICDIQSLKLVLKDTELSAILKISNEDNTLADVAKLINLYYNEEYFYEKIASIVNLEVPQFYCSLNIDNRSGLLMEDLSIYDGQFNIDLNLDIDTLLSVLKDITNFHNRFLFRNENDVLECMRNVLKIDQISYYSKLIKDRFALFISQNKCLLLGNEVKILNRVFSSFDKIFDIAGNFPLNFCHGDLKSPNIFYKKKNGHISPIFLDWQYIHLNKGISDITFLLTESTNFNEITNSLVLNYYFKKSCLYNEFEKMMFDFKVSLCIFPFFVCVWFNSENRDTLLDKVFPLRYLKNVLCFYNKYLDDKFFNHFEKNT